jgi:transposase-like protein
MLTREERFRRSVARSLGGRPGRGARYPEDLRREAMGLARTGMLAGKSLGSVAEELGLGPATLTRWLGRVGAGEPLRPVEVQREEEEAVQTSSLVVVTPSGWRIEGLRLTDLAELLRALG